MTFQAKLPMAAASISTRSRRQVVQTAPKQQQIDGELVPSPHCQTADAPRACTFGTSRRANIKLTMANSVCNYAVFFAMPW